jgi:hypothetical protein
MNAEKLTLREWMNLDPDDRFCTTEMDKVVGDLDKELRTILADPNEPRLTKHIAIQALSLLDSKGRLGGQNELSMEEADNRLNIFLGLLDRELHDRDIVENILISWHGSLLQSSVALAMRRGLEDNALLNSVRCCVDRICLTHNMPRAQRCQMLLRDPHQWHNKPRKSK